MMPYRPFSPVTPTDRGGTEDTRQCDAARCETRVDAFRAGPGAVPFADYLRALNIMARLERPPIGSPRDVGPERGGSMPIPVRRDDTLARLGEVLPVERTPAAPGAVERDVVLRPVGSGRLIDVVV